MSQTVATVAFEARPGSVTLLEKAITDFRTVQEAGSGASYGELKRDVPTLHFMSIMVFHDATYDPLLLIEVNFDGDPTAFWQALAAAIGQDLTAMLNLCAPPREVAAAKRFETLLRTDAGLADVLAAAAVYPTAFHLGNRGLTRAQIEADAMLSAKVEAELNGEDAAYRAQTPSEIHRRLRGALVQGFPWLQQTSPARVPAREHRADWLNILVFATLALAVLAAPGAILALVLPWRFAAALGVVTAVCLWSFVPDIKRLIPSGLGQVLLVAGIVLGSIVSAAVWLGLAALGLFLLAWASAQLDPSASVSLRPWMTGAAWRVLAGVITAPAVVLAVLFWLRRVELQDSTSTAPVLDPAQARIMAGREDRNSVVYQNHMGSIVMVKPGGLRSLLLRMGHHALHLALRVFARDGYLGDMRTVHFAHWALLNDKSRLLFMSNFDGTWDSYLDDFIEKAHRGTTLAWTNCVGAPLANFLVLDGVTKGRQFKQWARCSMAPNLFWFSAYPTLTVNQIERNHIIAEGLRQHALDAGRAAQWIRYL